MHFASKALPCAPLTRMLAEEGLGCDVASAGELAIALAAGFDPAHILLHGNAKSDRDVGDALAAGVGMIVIDGPTTSTASSGSRPRDSPSCCGSTPPCRASPTRRWTPAARRPSSASRSTPRRRCSTGSQRATAASCSGCTHIGSQLLDLQGFGRAAEAIATLGRFPVYDLGGGLGIAYTPEEHAPSIADYAQATVEALHTHLDPAARLIVEPGRSVVGRSLVTLYEVVTVKRGAHTHVAVNGGMGDNLEPMLYGQRFAPAIVDRERPFRDPRAGRAPLRERRRARAWGRAGHAGGRRPGGDPVHGRLLLLAPEQLQRRPPAAGRRVPRRRSALAVRRETMDDLLARDVG